MNQRVALTLAGADQDDDEGTLGRGLGLDAALDARDLARLRGRSKSSARRIVVQPGASTPSTSTAIRQWRDETTQATRAETSREDRR